MADLVVYHNPACGSSRGVLEILRDRGVDADVIQYLKTPPDRAELERLLALVDVPPADLVRKDKRFGELGLDAADYQTPDQVVALLLEHPELMQRPIIVRGERAVLGRPPDRVVALLD